jgi:hypothetical protein
MATTIAENNNAARETGRPALRRCLWVSRHWPTPEQKMEMENGGFDYVIELSGLGNMVLESDTDVDNFMRLLVQEVKVGGAVEVFGVFAAPVQARLSDTTEARGRGEVTGVPCYAAWNIQRTPEGGKPTFTHRRFVRVGFLDLR